MPLLLVLVFLIVPIIELYVIVTVGQAIGVLPTIALLLADALLGAALFRHEGRRAWQALRVALTERRVPGREVADGALVVLGGALLITPGFVTDVFGVLCLLPPTRAILRRLLTGVATRQLLGGAARPTPPSTTPPRPSSEVIEGEIVEPD